MIAFGPVPSRRLGKSLGINNIPPKICSYSCLYCQVGLTRDMDVRRREFYPLNRIVEDVSTKINNVLARGERIDYLTFVPDGEPTLDINLRQEIKDLDQFGIKIAVITNSSLLWQDDVIRDLLEADLVSVKIDSVGEETWRKINRPTKGLKLEYILNGIIEFSRIFKGELITETMLIKGLNDESSQVDDIARFISETGAHTSYLSIPTRPPAVTSIQAPDEAVINQSYQIFKEYLDHVECLIGYEGNAFAYSGDIEEDILSISAVHPIREDAVREILKQAGTGWELIRKLTSEGKLIAVEHKGQFFYLRKSR